MPCLAVFVKEAPEKTESEKHQRKHSAGKFPKNDLEYSCLIAFERIHEKKAGGAFARRRSGQEERCVKGDYCYGNLVWCHGAEIHL